MVRAAASCCHLSLPAIHKGSPKIQFQFVASQRQSVLGGLPAVDSEFEVKLDQSSSAVEVWFRLDSTEFAADLIYSVGKQACLKME